MLQIRQERSFQGSLILSEEQYLLVWRHSEDYIHLQLREDPLQYLVKEKGRQDSKIRRKMLQSNIK